MAVKVSVASRVSKPICLAKLMVVSTSGARVWMFKPYPKNAKLYSEIFKECKKCMGLRRFRKDLKTFNTLKSLETAKLRPSPWKGDHERKYHSGSS